MMVTRANGGVPRVLVVDDEAMLADLLAQALRHEGWETATAKDGLDALAKASSFHPDIVRRWSVCALVIRSCRSSSSLRVTRSLIACGGCALARTTT